MPLETIPTYPIETPQFNIAGENSAIRAANPNDPEDVQRVLETSSSREYRRRFTVSGDMPTINSIKDQIVKYGDPFNTLNHVLHGIDFTAEKAAAVFHVSRAVKHHDREVGELQGRVSIYRDVNDDDLHNSLDKERLEKSLPTVANRKCPRLQISWVRHPNANQGQMASGVRQALYQVYADMADFKDIEDDGHVNVPAVIVAYIEPNNKESARVAESCGFVKIFDDKRYAHDIWQVDWNRFLTKLKQPVLKGTRPSFKKT